jgi:cytochrome b subunit of formate dehydrogenase
VDEDANDVKLLSYRMRFRYLESVYAMCVFVCHLLAGRWPAGKILGMTGGVLLVMRAAKS